MNASPKRRALAALDPNASSPAPKLGLKPAHALPASPLKQRSMVIPALVLEPKKREVAMDACQDEHPSKKARVDAADESSAQSRSVPSSQNTAAESSRPASPAASSIFDSSMFDTSQATTVTEPDAEPAAVQPPLRSIPLPSPAQPRMTREQAREKAEILRLRLGLASYKLRTGQTDVPLDQLQMRPLPGARRTLDPGPIARSRSETVVYAPQTTRRPLPARRPSQEDLAQSRVKHEGDSAPRQQESHDDQPRPNEGRSVEIEIEIVETPAQDQPSELPELPRLSAAGAVNTPRRPSHLDVEGEAERLTSSAIRGGVASAMLSLSRS
ncbi:hypothetical protein GQ53DRAFT_839515 [Thozetella sp. PMI_491]|nr:hypothetical protein GQ53DRAFT_839515 [Thozetella sp. PMI_491]